MAIIYTRAYATWINDEAGGTEADADAFNTIEAGLDALYKLPNAKGDLIVATAADTLERQAVGADNTVFTAASGQSTGVVWQKVGNAMVADNAAIAQSKIAFNNFSSFVPTLASTGTQPSLGSGSTASGLYVEIGNFVFAYATIIFGTGSSAGTGTYRVSSPVTLTNHGTNETALGSGYLLGTGSNRHLVSTRYTSPTEVALVIDGGGFVTATAPFSFGDGHVISYQIFTKKG